MENGFNSGKMFVDIAINKAIREVAGDTPIGFTYVLDWGKDTDFMFATYLYPNKADGDSVVISFTQQRPDSRYAEEREFEAKLTVFHGAKEYTEDEIVHVDSSRVVIKKDDYDIHFGITDSMAKYYIESLIASDEFKFAIINQLNFSIVPDENND